LKIFPVNDNSKIIFSGEQFKVSLIPKELLSEVNQDNFHFNEQLQEAKNKELANEIMDHFKHLDNILKK